MKPESMKKKPTPAYAKDRVIAAFRVAEACQKKTSIAAGNRSDVSGLSILP
jgi:hypothetical protein